MKEDLYEKYFEKRDPYLTIVFENGRTLTRKRNQVGNLKSIDAFLASNLPFDQVTVINWDKVLCVRAATPIEIQTEKQREGQE